MNAYLDLSVLMSFSSSIFQSDNSSSLKSSAGRKCVLSAAIVESLQAKASKLEKLEIRQDNLATAMEVSLSDLVQLQVSESLKSRPLHEENGILSNLGRLGDFF